MSNIYLFCFWCARSNTSTFNERSNVKPLSMRDKSVKSTCLSPLLSVDLISLGPRGRHFLFLAGVLNPPPRSMLFRHPVIYCPESPVWRESTQRGWLREQPAAHCLTHTHSHMTIPGGLAEMFTAQQSLHTIGPRAMDRETNRRRHPQQLLPASGVKLLQQNRKCEATGLMTRQGKCPWRLRKVHTDRAWQHSLRLTFQPAGLTWEHVLRNKLWKDILREGVLIQPLTYTCCMNEERLRLTTCMLLNDLKLFQQHSLKRLTEDKNKYNKPFP